MRFEDILPAVRAGGKAARPEWAERGCWLEMVPAHPAPDGRRLAPALVIGGPADDPPREMWTWARSDRDLLAGDWYLLADGPAQS